MGIKGLWKEIEGCPVRGHLSQLKNERIGVDAFAWLHRGALPSAANLAQGIACNNYLSFFERRLELLRNNKITGVIVFDGRAVPMKEDTNNDRRERRTKAKEDAEKALAVGDREKAVKLYEQCIEITPEMVLSAIQLVKDRFPSFVCIVAPYEADPQLAYLCKHNIIHGVISEDGDLLMYGCPKLISKLDAHGGCDIVALRDVLKSKSYNIFDPKQLFPLQQYQLQDENDPVVSMATTFHQDMFLICGILSGCDYTPSYPGIGMRKATNIVFTAVNVVKKKYQPDIDKAFHKISQNNNNNNKNNDDDGGLIRRTLCKLMNSTGVLQTALDHILENYATTNQDGKFDDYREKVNKAFYCFKHHIVYNYSEQRLVPFHEVPHKNGVPMKDIVGIIYDSKTAKMVCEDATLSAKTLKPYNYKGSLYDKSLQIHNNAIRGGAGQRTISDAMNQYRMMNNRKNNNDDESGNMVMTVYTDNSSSIIQQQQTQEEYIKEEVKLEVKEEIKQEDPNSLKMKFAKPRMMMKGQQSNNNNNETASTTTTTTAPHHEVKSKHWTSKKQTKQQQQKSEDEQKPHHTAKIRSREKTTEEDDEQQQEMITPSNSASSLSLTQSSLLSSSSSSSIVNKGNTVNSDDNLLRTESSDQDDSNNNSANSSCSNKTIKEKDFNQHQQAQKFDFRSFRKQEEDESQATKKANNINNNPPKPRLGLMRPSTTKTSSPSSPKSGNNNNDSLKVMGLDSLLTSLKFKKGSNNKHPGSSF